jgi:DNA-binding transcriptional MerR regulator
MREPEGYRVPEVCKLVGISYRQLDYWARTELVTPSVRDAGGSGTQRLYSFQDLVLLKVIKKLLDTGVSLQRIRKAVEYLQTHLKKEPVGVTLMSDGNRIYACHSNEEVVDVLSHGQAVFGIAVGRVWADTEGDLAHLPGDQPAAEEVATAAGPAAATAVAEAAVAQAVGDATVADAAGGVPSRAAPPGTQG